MGVGITLLAACTALQPAPTTAPRPATPTLTTPDPLGTAAAFLDAWEAGDFVGMYSLLSPLSRDAIGPADFQTRYQAVARTAAVTSVDGQVLSALKDGTNAQVLYDLTLRTANVGDIARRIEMPLVFVDGRWSVAWSDGLILPELANGGVLRAEFGFPARSNIYDRSGLGLAVQGDAVAIGLQPGLITDEPRLLAVLAGLLRTQPEAIQARYANARPNWYVPIGEISAQEAQANQAALAALDGVILTNYRSRYYPFGGVAPHVVGYLSPIMPEEVGDYRARGYTGDERVGRAGLEAWGEQYLAGTPTGRLIAVSPDGGVTPVAERQRQPSQAIYTTLDRELQLAAQQALGGFRGSIIILNPADGAVLAMASSPAFDPNLFDPTTRNSSALQAVLDDPANPLLNRATQGVYPPGSIFKIAVMGAGLLSDLYAPGTIVDCKAAWTGLGPSAIKYDWTVAAGIPPRGKIDLVQALAFSCNTYFYQVAFDLHTFDGDFLPRIGRQFGLGEFTGIGQIAEAQGVMPDAAWKQATYTEPWLPGDSVNMGIGQGYLLVTPLQVAEMTAALRNGGTLFRPQVVDRILPPGGDPIYTFSPVVNGRLPVTPDQLAAIKAGLHAVTSEAGGTARHRFLNLGIPVAGKTGTAEDPAGGLPHAWFAGYTEAERPDRPDIAMVVMIENIGDGSAYAAPIFRRLVEIYFFGEAITLLPWESEFGVPATPTATP